MENNSIIDSEESIEILYTSLHQLDHEKDLIKEIKVDNNREELNQYIQKLLHDISKKENIKSYTFRSENTEVRSSLNLMLNEDYVKASTNINKRLLDVEKKSQLLIKQLKVKIQKGTLFQTVIKEIDKIKIIIAKADHDEFLDDSDFSLREGLPWKKRIFKSFLVTFDANQKVSEILISDTTSSITKYWWDNFLELSEVRTDKHNTERYLELLDKKVFFNIKKGFPSDFTIIRNSTLGYFRSNQDFNLKTFVDLIFNNYSPVDEKLPLNEIINKISSFPEKYSLDSQFSIDKKSIKKRAIDKIQLQDGIDLILDSTLHSPDLEMIEAYCDNEGNKFIKIKTEIGYNRFKK